ncbi:hypothetical protein [Methanocella arvoryzae]|uniref:hypothetical protein n=1 Tax=Methanocella arvoryzae TaxID=1175445 RepID=UPI000325B60E|nr:hypothetical protein [Methanocella arvoryzae]
MTHPLQEYFCEAKDGRIGDEKAREDITGLVNNMDLIKDACAIFGVEKNNDTACYTVGKVYDVHGESYGCVTVLSDDVVHVIGQDEQQEIHEKLNFMLVTTYLEFRRLCKDKEDAIEIWDGYLDLVMSRNFLPLYENGVRARLIHNGSIEQAKLPTVVYVLYQSYDAVYG